MVVPLCCGQVFLPRQSRMGLTIPSRSRSRREACHDYADGSSAALHMMLLFYAAYQIDQGSGIYGRFVSPPGHVPVWPAQDQAMAIRVRDFLRVNVK